MSCIDDKGTLIYSGYVSLNSSTDEAVDVLLALYKKRIRAKVFGEDGQELHFTDLVPWETFRDRYFDEGFCTDEKATAVLEAAIEKAERLDVE